VIRFHRQILRGVDTRLKWPFYTFIFIGDLAHDNYLLTARSITPIIALNERHTGYYRLDGHLTTDKSGAPVCPKGETVVAGGFCPDWCRMSSKSAKETSCL